MGIENVKEIEKDFDSDRVEKKDVTNVESSDNADNNRFITHIQLVSIGSIGIIVLILILLNIFTHNTDDKFTLNIINDFKGILIGTIVGLIFSVVLALKSIRNYLLTSAASFMAGENYLKKLSPDVLQTLRNKVYNIIYGIDMTSNDQSLFNYIKNMENKLINTPHKSATDELLVYKFFDEDKNIFKVRRTQNFRIHTLDIGKHNKFPLNTQMIMNKSEHFTVDQFKENFKFILKVNNEIISSIYTADDFENCIKKSTNNNDVHIKFTDEEGKINISIQKELVLTSDFTDVEVITERLEPNEGSFGLLSNVASYIYEAKFIFPECLKITNLYHDRTIYTSNNKDLRLDGQFDDNIATFVNKNWQLPGLVVTLTFE